MKTETLLLRQPPNTYSSQVGFEQPHLLSMKAKQRSGGRRCSVSIRTVYCVWAVWGVLCRKTGVGNIRYSLVFSRIGQRMRTRQERLKYDHVKQSTGGQDNTVARK